MTYQRVEVPAHGQPIHALGGAEIEVPNNPIVPYIVGDGIGIDVTPAMRWVVDAAVKLAYGDQRAIAWMEVFAGTSAVAQYGPEQYLPDETLRALKEFVVSIKGPLATPTGSGIRSLNVAIRQDMDLYACVRPVRYFHGVMTTSKVSDSVDAVVFRENTEDIYTGIEWPAESPQAQKLIAFLQTELGVDQIRFPDSSSIGIKAVSREGSQRLVRKAIDYAIEFDHESVALVHKGNIMKFTEGGFLAWGYELARERYGAEPLNGGPWLTLRNPKTKRSIIIKDVIADNFLQQIILNPGQYEVIATLNLNGDYISDALAALVGGIGISPGANIGDGYAVFEATHGTAPDIAGKGVANPGSLILSAEMMLRYMAWPEAADLILNGVTNAIFHRELTFDLAVIRESMRGLYVNEPASDEGPAMMEGVTMLDTRGFAEAVVRRMGDSSAI